MKRFRSIVCSAAALLVLTVRAPVASAATSAGELRDERSQAAGPNRALLRSGLWTLGLAYAPSVLVAIESSVPADDQLYVPVAGPWLDYANRDCEACAHENLNKVLLVTDGVVQGLGALQVFGSFLLPEKAVTPREAREGERPRSDGQRKVSTPRLRVTPAKLGSAFGIAATGRF